MALGNVFLINKACQNISTSFFCARGIKNTFSMRFDYNEIHVFVLSKPSGLQRKHPPPYPLPHSVMQGVG
jgi:hypothetical protein